jgi:hypothetical protein
MTFSKTKFATGRLTILLCASFVLSLCAATAQTAEVKLPSRETTLGELFDQIDRQTASKVVFSPEGAILSRRVTLPSTEGTVARMLDAVLPAEGLGWKMVGSYIAVGPRQPEPAAPRPAARPIVIHRRELRSFAAGERRAPDSVLIRTVEYDPAALMIDRRNFALPGTVLSAAPSKRALSRFALKTNVLHGAAGLAPNLYGEAGLGGRTTLEAGFARNGRNRNGSAGDNRKLIHGGVTGELRWWPCERFNGHFFGAHAFWRFYNVGGHDLPFVDFRREFRYEGTAIGGGLSYGYSLPLATRLNAEFYAGVGVALMKYDRYGCDKCEALDESVTRTYFGPTRLGVTLSFIIK